MGGDQVDVLEVIGEHDASTGAFTARSFDSQGTTGTMEVRAIGDGVLTFTGTSERATLTIAEDGASMAARWERSAGGSGWRHWMDMTFTKLA